MSIHPDSRLVESQEAALSLRQPWAALVVHGLKTIEIRSWSTELRGRILIHAARIPDPRDHAWRLLPARFQETATLRGGILGEALLHDCIAYREPEAFAMDRAFHLNDLAWYEGPVLYGFVFCQARVLPFRPLRGSVRFFTVPR